MDDSMTMYKMKCLGFVVEATQKKVQRYQHDSSINHHSSIFYHPAHNGSMQLGPVTQHCPPLRRRNITHHGHAMTTTPDCYDAATHDTTGTQ